MFGKLSATRRKVYQYDLNKNLIKIYESITSVYKENEFLKLSGRQIKYCLSNKRDSYRGFIWSFTPLESN